MYDNIKLPPGRGGTLPLRDTYTDLVGERIALPLLSAYLIRAMPVAPAKLIQEGNYVGKKSEYYNRTK